jgi:hypothetical protein
MHMAMTVTLILSIAAFVLTILSTIPATGVLLWIPVLLICITLLVMQLPKG